VQILVTGAAVFLESQLFDRLMADGREVLGLDNFFTGSRRNFAQFLAHPNIEPMRHYLIFPLFVDVDATI
jgi:UDP-glucuronate decarboxylase